MRRISVLKCYAGVLTAGWVFIIYMFLMYTYTQKDLLEIIVSFVAFLMIPAFLVPYFIVKEDDDEDAE